MDKLTPKFLILTLMIFAAAFVRLLPHPPNFPPIAAMALFGGAYFNKKWAAFLVPLAAMFITRQRRPDDAAGRLTIFIQPVALRHSVSQAE